MRISQIAGLALALSSLSGAKAVGQSLGDVARQQRDQLAQNGNSGSKKIITNEDLPEHPDSDVQPSEQNSSYPPPSNDLHSARQWKAAILQQKKVVTSLQKQVDDMKASIHFVEGTRYYYGVQYNQRQLQKLQQVDQMQKQLNYQKRFLENLQEAARRAGFGNSVYEP